MKTKKPLVSVIIVNYNGKHLLKRAIESLQKQDFKYGIEVIIVDNNSSDGSEDFVKKNYKSVKWIQTGRNISYPAANYGVDASKGSYILFANNDVEFKKNCLRKMYDVLKKDNQTGMVVPKLVNYYNRKIDSKGTWVSRAFYCGHITSERDDKESKIKEVPYMGIGLLRKDTIKKLGYLLDIDYFLYAEDLDLSLRLRLLGYRVMYVPNAVVYHIHSATMDKYATNLRKTFLFERNLLTTFLKVCSFHNILILLPYVLFMRLILMLKDLVTFRLDIFFARLKALFWIVFNIFKVYKKRKYVQNRRKEKDKFMFRIFNESEMLKALRNRPI